MSLFLKQLSGFFFYVLGASLFVAYLLMHNSIRMQESTWWLQRADLPFAIVALLYGGTSLYRSLHTKEEFSPILAVLIALPLMAFFIFLVLLNFWGILGLPQGEMLL
ncbi:MAG: hypothetical protein WCX61_03985 [Candidatus Peribacteraceae bacterium]|jgi:hypothetical protein